MEIDKHTGLVLEGGGMREFLHAGCWTGCWTTTLIFPTLSRCRQGRAMACLI